jgi:hypothetical protein
MKCRQRYGSKKVRKGASTEAFALLSEAEQIERVRKLKAARLPDDAICQLTGLGKLEVWQMLEAKNGQETR